MSRPLQALQGPGCFELIRIRRARLQVFIAQLLRRARLLDGEFQASNRRPKKGDAG
jgi:hypothetical protein